MVARVFTRSLMWLQRVQCLVGVIDYLFVFVGAVFVALRSVEPDLIP